MQWQLVKFNLFAKLVLAIGLWLTPVLSGLAFDENRLWLPSQYQTLYLDLKKAAEVAESIDRCVVVLDGTLDLDRSSDGHPVYRILCRQQNGKSYNEMVDGVSFRTLTTKVPIVLEPTAEELEQMRLAEERKRAEELRIWKLNMWKLCQSTFTDKTSLMINLVLITQNQPEPNYIDESRIQYIIDFDAENQQGDKLRFRSICVTENNLIESFKIRRRVN
ncbi:hypothetical protein [Teredinibacter sp. KSP-S5-2]|uniref:hypothetical protein n=1 Tax=Teredinibacter sp. KSP-S5-2 TaxID=3034506 RepID=UPI00293515D2|nr:hypothetical protein [Teredinibacter sp. KSP-S5-2]WNO10154.1 hypothetical protein P5V12_03110 [Teredinibacter sp. KSP-S5-2]